MFQKPTHEDRLDPAIDSLLLEIQGNEDDPDEYAKRIKALDMLYKMQAQDKPDRVSKDTLAIIAGNLGGIIMILGFEKANVITTKALSFVMKAR